MGSPDKPPSRPSGVDDPLQALARAIQRRHGAAAAPGTSQRRLQALKRELRAHRFPRTPAAR